MHEDGHILTVWMYHNIDPPTQYILIFGWYYGTWKILLCIFVNIAYAEAKIDVLKIKQDSISFPNHPHPKTIGWYKEDPLLSIWKYSLRWSENRCI